ncbi:cytochrome c [Flavobacterium tistrianum]|nr:cytochrome c [Flavobacterium tistrianum]
MKRIHQILLYSISSIIVLVGVIFYEMETYEPPINWYCNTPVPNFCGTPNLSETQEKGREVFNANCAACHKLDARSTGPALRGVDSLVFVKWIIGKNHKIDTAKIEDLGIDYHRTMFTEYVNGKDLQSIIEYCSRERNY